MHVPVYFGGITKDALMNLVKGTTCWCECLRKHCLQGYVVSKHCIMLFASLPPNLPVNILCKKMLQEVMWKLF